MRSYHFLVLTGFTKHVPACGSVSTTHVQYAEKESKANHQRQKTGDQVRLDLDELHLPPEMSIELEESASADLHLGLNQDQSETCPNEMRRGSIPSEMLQDFHRMTLNHHLLEDGKSLENRAETTTKIIVDECLGPTDDEIQKSVLRINERAVEDMEVMHHANRAEVHIPVMEMGVEMGQWHGYEIGSQGTIR